MQIVKLSALILICASILLQSGCGEVGDLKVQNETQRKRIAELESEIQTTELLLDKSKRELATIGGRNDVQMDALNQKIDALEEDLARKKNLINQMQHRLLLGGAALPVELSTMLDDFAKNKDMVTYDSSRGVVKFKSDLLFKRGSDAVTADAAKAIKALCAILNTEQGKELDIMIAGHTDDLRIARPATRQKHPTNWHLSAHRAISVLKIMENSNIASARMSARGFGEFRPIEPNKPNKKGNPLNRRVEIYIVGKGI